MPDDSKNIAFIGIGKMGLPMSALVAKAGYAVTAFDHSAARLNEARELYRRFAAGKATPELTWQDIIRGDFLAIRNAGLSHSLMTEIEQSLLTS